MKTTNKERVYNGHFKIDKYTLQDDEGKTHIEECFERGNSVAAVIFDKTKQKFIFTEQFRIGPHGEKQTMIEVVAGSMDIQNETPIKALIREVSEELGYVIEDLKDIEFIGSFYVSPGGSSEKIHLFFVEVTEKVLEGGGKKEEGENISFVEMSIAEIKTHSFDDAKTIIGVQYVLMQEYEAHAIRQKETIEQISLTVNKES